MSNGVCVCVCRGRHTDGRDVCRSGTGEGFVCPLPRLARSRIHTHKKRDPLMSTKFPLHFTDYARPWGQRTTPPYIMESICKSISRFKHAWTSFSEPGDRSGLAVLITINTHVISSIIIIACGLSGMRDKGERFGRGVRLLSSVLRD